MQAIDLLQAPAASTPRNNLVNRWQGGPHNRFGRFGEEKNILFLQGFETRIVQGDLTFCNGPSVKYRMIQYLIN